MQPSTNLLETIIKAIMAYFVIEAIFGLFVIGLFVLILRKMIDR